MSGLHYIVGLASKDLLNNSMFVDRKEFGKMATMMVFFPWLDFLKDLGHSRLPYASLGGNLPARMIKKSKKNDIIPLSSREVFHGSNKEMYL